MAIIERKKSNGSFTYQVKVRDPQGDWYPSKSFSDRLEAQEHELNLKKMNRAGEVLCSSDAKETSVSEYWEVWSAENRSKSSVSWVSSQNQMWRDYIEPVIGNVMMAKVKPPHILKILNRMRDGSQMRDGKPRSEATCLLVYATLQKMFGDAVGFYEMLAKSPVLPKHHRPAVSKKLSRFLEPKDAWTLLDGARPDPVLGPPVWLELLAGLRREATLALMWPDISWDTSQAVIRRAFKTNGQRVIVDFPKGKDWEYVPMPRPLLDYLFEVYQGVDPHGFVCRGPNGGMLKPETYAPRLKALCRRIGLPEWVSPHKLRHSASEIYVSEGASQVDVQRLLNHKDASTTARYMHRTDERLRAIAGRISRPDLRVVGGGNKDVPENVPSGEQLVVRGTRDEAGHAI